MFPVFILILSFRRFIPIVQIKESNNKISCLLTLSSGKNSAMHYPELMVNVICVLT